MGDVVVDPPDEEALLRLVSAMPLDAHYVDRDAARDAWTRRSIFNVIDQASGWKVDIIVREERPFSREELSKGRESGSPRRVGRRTCYCERRSVSFA